MSSTASWEWRWQPTAAVAAVVGQPSAAVDVVVVGQQAAAVAVAAAGVVQPAAAGGGADGPCPAGKWRSYT